jgi:response regulator NasT
MEFSQSGGIRIAIADDQPDVRGVFVKFLEALGHTVVYAAGNGDELVNKCADLSVDVVFVDLDMPVMDGLAAGELLAAKGIPVVLVSGHPDAEEVVLEHEPFAWRIRKPASPESVTRAIERALAWPGRKTAGSA